MDLILTGRAVGAEEAEAIGLANRVVPHGEAVPSAVALAHELAVLPQTCMRNDRLSAIEQWDLTEEDATRREIQLGLRTIGSGETLSGASAFRGGAGRGGTKR